MDFEVIKLNVKVTEACSRKFVFQNIFKMLCPMIMQIGIVERKTHQVKG